LSPQKRQRATRGNDNALQRFPGNKWDRGELSDRREHRCSFASLEFEKTEYSENENEHTE
jgi:hypothetical protein